MLYRNPEADKDHSAGLAAAEAGDYALAAAYYKRAARRVRPLINRELWASMQYSRAMRDLGWLAFRGALTAYNKAEPKTQELETMLHDALSTARKQLEKVQANTVVRAVGSLGKLRDTRPIPEDRAELAEDCAEHGATVSLLFRLDAFEIVHFGAGTPVKDNAKRHARGAADFLVDSSNRYYQTSHAMHCAELATAVAIPHFGNKGPWLEVAENAVTQAQTEHSVDLAAAQHVFDARLPNVTDARTAREAIQSHP